MNNRTMENDYTQFLLAKLYLIECISLKGKLNGNETLTKIHNICLMGDPKQLVKLIRESHVESN